MKVFLSHKQQDEPIAAAIAHRLRTQHDVDCYLDVFDPHASKAGDALGDYIRYRLGQCSDLMAVVSDRTKESWWVPWEIGVATEKDHPISTFAGDQCELPTYLKKWPYLRTMRDVDVYVGTRRKVDRERYRKKSYGQPIFESYAKQFHRDLKAVLGQ